MTTFKVQPIITEKSSLDSRDKKFHFKLPAGINKIEVAKALTKMYGVDVEKVNIIKLPAKERLVGRGRVMTKRKAMVKAIVTFADVIDVNKPKTTKKEAKK